MKHPEAPIFIINYEHKDWKGSPELIVFERMADLSVYVTLHRKDKMTIWRGELLADWRSKRCATI
jgi:hypothetical protein